MIDVIVRICGSIFVAGIGTIALAVGLLIISAFIAEVKGRILD